MLENRCRILAAAARIYAQFGFRGATTRRIAHEAGVNEVTLFRTFGSKDALIEEALRHVSEEAATPQALPEVPVDPARELCNWATLQLAELRKHRALISQAMSDLEERSDLAPCVASGFSAADVVLQQYLERLGTAGFVEWATPAAALDAAPDASVDEVPTGTPDIFAARSMFMAALFSDAMGRAMMPDLYPQPAERAPALYVQLFLRAIGCRTPAEVRAPDPATHGDAPRAGHVRATPPRGRRAAAESQHSPDR